MFSNPINQFSRSNLREAYLTKRSEVYFAKPISRILSQAAKLSVSRETYLSKSISRSLSHEAKRSVFRFSISREVYLVKPISQSLSPLNPRISAETSVNCYNRSRDKCRGITAEPLQSAQQIIRFPKSPHRCMCDDLIAPTSQSSVCFGQ